MATPVKQVFREYASGAIADFLNTEGMYRQLRKSAINAYRRSAVSFHEDNPGELTIEQWIDELKVGIEQMGSGYYELDEIQLSESWLLDVLKFYLEFFSSLFHGVSEDYDKR